MSSDLPERNMWETERMESSAENESQNTKCYGDCKKLQTCSNKLLEKTGSSQGKKTMDVKQ